MQEIVEKIIEQLREELPPIFLGSKSNELTGGAICWATIQNKRSRREIPPECFIRSGPRVLVVRDRFLSWWATILQPAQETANTYAPRPNAGRRIRTRAG